MASLVSYKGLQLISSGSLGTAATYTNNQFTTIANLLETLTNTKLAKAGGVMTGAITGTGLFNVNPSDDSITVTEINCNSLAGTIGDFTINNSVDFGANDIYNLNSISTGSLYSGTINFTDGIVIAQTCSFDLTGSTVGLDSAFLTGACAGLNSFYIDAGAESVLQAYNGSFAILDLQGITTSSHLKFTGGGLHTVVTGTMFNQPADDAIYIDWDNLTIGATDFYGAINTNLIRDYNAGGIQIGQNISDKLGFLGATAIPRRASANQTGITDSTGGTPSTTISAITAGTTYSQTDMTNVKNALASITRLLNQIRADLVAYGLIKGSA